MIVLARVAQLIVHHPGGRRRGSGYLITSTAVLTAAHVIDGADSVEVRFSPDKPDERTVLASGWEMGDADIAVLTIEALFDVEPAKFGRVGNHPAILDVQAVGFPRWKMRNDDGTIFVDGEIRSARRDSYHLRGTAAVFSNTREDTIEVEIQSAPGIVDPWEGMSGAAVWAGDLIVGVISAHHPSEGSTRLTAARISNLGPIRPVTTDVTGSDHRVTRSHRAQLAQIAPVTLEDRDEELKELTRFCMSDAPYAWWQADPWAGKTALLASFALDPPSGIDVVSFFITNRLAGQADSGAFARALLEQLGVLAGEPVQDLLQSGSPYRDMLGLLKELAADRRLLLVVDGLDEDNSTGMGLPSIASLLPRRAIPGLRVLIASRPHPDLPTDVPSDHLLRSTEIRQLRAFPGAQATEINAQNELMRSLRGPQFHQDVLGLLTAAGGGLTDVDLADLTGQALYELKHLLGGPFGRSLTSRYSTDPPSERTYLFAHETLRTTAECEFGARVVVYQKTLHEWADRYQRTGWPDRTPSYLIRGYPRLLAQLRDLERMQAFALDRARHDRILDHTGGDVLALAEITAAARLQAEQPHPDLVALVRMALVRDTLVERNLRIPEALPAVWVTLGRPARGVALADGMVDGGTRIAAIVRLVGALVRRGDVDQAIELAQSVAADRDRSRVLGSAVNELIAAGNRDKAEQIAHDMPDSVSRDWAISRVAASVAFDQADRAIELVQRIRSPRVQARALAALACMFHAAGRGRPELLDEAEQTILLVQRDRGLALGELARAFALTGEHQRAQQLITRIEPGLFQTWAQAEFISIAHTQGAEVDAIVRQAVADAGDISQSTERSIATWPLLAAYTRADHDGWAVTTAASLPRSFAADRVRVSAAAELDRRGHTEAATALIAEISTTSCRDAALSRRALAEPDKGKAQELALSVSDVTDQVRLLTKLGDADMAEVTVRSIEDPLVRSHGLTILAAMSTGPEQAAVLAGEAEKVARTITDSYRRSQRDRDLVRALIGAGNLSAAGQISLAMEDPSSKIDAIEDVTRQLMTKNHVGEAQALAREFAGQHIANHRLPRLVDILTLVKLADVAMRVVKRIQEPTKRIEKTLDVLLELTPKHLSAHVRLLDTVTGNVLDMPDLDVRIAERLVQVQVRAANLDTAEFIMNMLRTRMGRVSAHILDVVTDARWFDTAMSAARSISDPVVKVRTLCKLIVRPVAASVAFAEAKAVTRTITDPADRIVALCSIARHISSSVDDGGTAEAERLIQEAGTAISEVAPPARDGLAAYLKSTEAVCYQLGKPFARPIRSSTSRIRNVITPYDFTRTREPDRNDLKTFMKAQVTALGAQRDQFDLEHLVNRIIRAELERDDEAVAWAELMPLLVKELTTTNWSSVLPAVGRIAPETLPIVLEALHSNPGTGSGT